MADEFSKLFRLDSRPIRVTLLLFAISLLLLIVIAGASLFRTFSSNDQLEDQVSQLQEQLGCLQESTTEFNTAVSQAISVLLDLNDANTDLNTASIELNSVVVEALVAVAASDDAQLDASLGRADEVVAGVDPYLERAATLAASADEVKLALDEALESRKQAIEECGAE